MSIQKMFYFLLIATNECNQSASQTDRQMNLNRNSGDESIDTKFKIVRFLQKSKSVIPEAILVGNDNLFCKSRYGEYNSR